MELYMRNLTRMVLIVISFVTVIYGQRITDEVQSCRDYRGHTVQIGQVYKPFRSDPCIDCVCRKEPRAEGDVNGCLTVQCAAPPCEKYELIPEECCGYICISEDVDRPLPIVNNGTLPWCKGFDGKEVAIGETYKPSFEEPCIECKCDQNPREAKDYKGCMTVMCDQPECDRFEQIPGECCEHRCLNDGPNDNLLPPGGLQSLPNQLEPCCQAGKEWYKENREQCPAYTGTFADGTQEEQSRCKSILSVCCIQEMQDRNCERGKSTALVQRNCDSLYSYQFNRDSTKVCCDCCLLGTKASGLGLPCDMALQPFNLMCRSTFTECCQGPQSLPSTAPTTTPTTTTTAAPTTTTTMTSPPTGTTTPFWEGPEENYHLCQRFPGQLCAQICIDTPGSYRCACREGFELQRDGRTCSQEVHTNRCNINNPCDHLCVDTGIAIECTCFDGYVLKADGFTCQDIDECKAGTHNCVGRQTCANTEGSYTCLGPVDDTPEYIEPVETCEVGYAFNSVTERCEDIDECIINRFTCKSDEECVNNEGSYVCRQKQPELQCGRGFFFDRNTGTCADIDECETGSHRCTEPTQTCRNTVGSFVCSCEEGFVYNRRTGECEDINECALNYDNCLIGQQCVNNVGSYVCRRALSCGTGYTIDQATQECQDIDECLLETHDCGAAYECRNIPGSFRCDSKKCPRGYVVNVVTGTCDFVVCARGLQADAAGNCIDINECSRATSPCRPNQQCRNTVGSYICRDLMQCRPGYELDEQGFRCVDIDECTRGTDDCNGLFMRCINRPGTYICACPEGYQLNHETRRCEDVDECNSPYGGRVCDLNARCENVEGSFRCICNEGFENEGSYCKDINECENAGMCQHTCRNTRGSFLCSCFEGYQLAVDGRTCEDVDECAVWAQRGGSLCLGVCRNTMGSYQCECPDGYRMEADGRTCQDIDECAERTANCFQPDDQCINTRGGYKCETITCPKGFIKAPSLSNRNNAIRCQRQTFVCPQGDTECLYAPLSLSYNFITFPEKIRIPADLFTMRGPQSYHRRLEFELDLVTAKDPVTGEERVDKSFFTLIKTADHEALVRLVEEIKGPQDIELKLNMNIYSREFREDQEEIFFGTAIAVIKIYVTQDYY